MKTREEIIKKIDYLYGEYKYHYSQADNKELSLKVRLCHMNNMKEYTERIELLNWVLT